MRQAQQIINSQADMSRGVKRSAWLLFQHELNRINPDTAKRFTVNRALSNVLKWMAGQEARQRHFSQLTVRELEILQMLVEGVPQKKIALEMRLTERMIRWHSRQIRKKVNVSSLYQAIAIAVERGWVQVPKTDD
jgi:DNA-binding NarL/FixJ family response regulator